MRKATQRVAGTSPESEVKNVGKKKMVIKAKSSLCLLKISSCDVNKNR